MMKAYRRPLVQALLPGDIDKGVKWADDYLEAAERDFTCPTSCGRMKQFSTWMDMLRGIICNMVSPEPTCFDGMQQSEEGWCDDLGWADQRPYHWPFFINGSVIGKCTFSYNSRECGQPCKLSRGKMKNLLFSSMMEPQLIMNPC